jgi:cytochrome c oxidase cbb3-type subunit 3
MNSAVSLFIVIFTLVNILACLWLMWWTAKRRGHSDAEKTGHVWDGDLEEYNNPLPRWWLGLFILTIVFALGYLIYYPGLGNFAGTSGWTQESQHRAEVESAQARLERHLTGLGDATLEELAVNDTAMGTARNLFGLYCSTCHGSDARGAKGFPNLADNDWLWGGDTATIYQSIAQGRTGVMPGWKAALGDKGVEEMIAYVLSLSGRKVPQDMAAAAQPKYAAMCIACHGAEGKGNPALGAPNLTDDVWLYGGSVDAVRETIANGRNNQMPPHEDLLGPMKTKLLAAYVLNLSSQSKTAGAAGTP